MGRFLLVGKVALILVLMVLLLVPMGHIRDLVRERMQLRDQVLQDIERSAAHAQTLVGPVLIVPYTRTRAVQSLDRDQRPVTLMREESGELRLLPETLDVRGTLATEERRRGIYRARIYRAPLLLSGRFQVPAQYGVTEDAGSYRFGQPRLALGISDIRGIGNALTLQAGGRSIAFQPGSSTTLLKSGVHAQLGEFDPARAQLMDYEIALSLTGSRQLDITPVGGETNVNLEADWPHPAFVGEFLPREREVRPDGFSAHWQTSFFATSLQEAVAACAAHDAASCADFNARRFGVSFIDPVDQYLKSERAAKYAFLFIGLTFAGFFLTEVLRRVQVHPVQYGLVGLALAVFFLLLLSLSEHIGFAPAYAVSAAACVGLVSFYVAHVLASRGRGLGFGAALAGLYGLLYGILSSEDYALLMGSLFVFAVLAAVMVLTRQVSWTALDERR